MHRIMQSTSLMCAVGVYILLTYSDVVKPVEWFVFVTATVTA